jgi:hypothetical protein
VSCHNLCAEHAKSLRQPTDRYRDGAVGVIVAPALLAAAADIIPSPRPSGLLPGPSARKKKPTVPIAAMMPAIVAGTKAFGSCVPVVCGRGVTCVCTFALVLVFRRIATAGFQNKFQSATNDTAEMRQPAGLTEVPRFCNVIPTVNTRS